MRVARFSVTERVGVIARIRALAVGVAKAYVDQQKAEQVSYRCRRKARGWGTRSCGDKSSEVAAQSKDPARGEQSTAVTESDAAVMQVLD